jgi:hypothetical protein
VPAGLALARWGGLPAPFQVLAALSVAMWVLGWLVLPPLRGQLELRGGMWRLKAQVADPAPVAPAPVAADAGRGRGWRPWLLGALGGALLIGWVLLRRRRGR